MRDQAERLRVLASEKKDTSMQDNEPLEVNEIGPEGCVISFVSGKGGVGKSVIALNLAIAFAQHGNSVVLVDADLNLANTDVLLNLSPSGRLADFLLGKKDIDEILVKAPGGFWLIAGNSGAGEIAEFNLNEQERLFHALARKFDIILFDTSAGLHDWVISLTLLSDITILVTTPEPTALMDAYALLKVVLMHSKTTPVRFIINQAEAGEVKDVHSKLQIITKHFLQHEMQVLGGIPYDQQIHQSVMAQIPLMIQAPTSRSAQAINTLASYLVSEYNIEALHDYK